MSKYLFEKGWHVALNLGTEITGSTTNVLVGEVQAVDARGVRITLMDWLLGMPTGNDFYAPWSAIRSSLIATDQHDLGMFLEEASKWQERTDRANVVPVMSGDAA